MGEQEARGMTPQAEALLGVLSSVKQKNGKYATWSAGILADYLGFAGASYLTRFRRLRLLIRELRDAGYTVRRNKKFYRLEKL